MTRYHATADGNVPFTAEEEAQADVDAAAWVADANDRTAAQVREERDEKLKASDWRASSDLTLSTEWATYRQALRDVPSQTGFPNTITWPAEPEE